VVALVVLAAALRLPGLMDRGIFDADQGREMFVLFDLVKLGQLPLVGPEVISIAGSNLHHGALYWYLFAPAAWLSGGDPTAVVYETAFIGIASVGATWWAARMMGSPVVAALAGLLMAVSPAAVEQSIFLWNPNPVPFFAALALGGAWRAHQTGRARWYVLAIGGAVAVYQLHLLGAAFVIGIGFLVGYDAIRAIRDDPARRAGLVRGLAGGAVVSLVLFLPLIVHEAQTGFGETQALIQFLFHGSGSPGGGALDPVDAVIFVVIRIVGWPFVGLVLDAPVPAILVVATWAVLVLWWLVAARGEERLLMRWLLGIVAFSTVALAVMAPTLQFVVPGFPTDHYHAFLNPAILISGSLAGVAFASGAGAARRDRPRSRAGDTAARMLVAGAIVAELVLAIARQPAATDVGTWPSAARIGEQIVTLAGGGRIALIGLPSIKSPDNIGYPIAYLGGHVIRDPARADYIVVNCDDRFHESILKEHCDGGPEDKAVAEALSGQGEAGQLVSRIKESDALRISVYEVVPTQP
jgi:4-amino-4-deoxy-L-arabinose transferase-like glycosyltransferase